MTMRKSLFSLGKRATVGWWGRGLRRRLSVAPGTKRLTTGVELVT